MTVACFRIDCQEQHQQVGVEVDGGDSAREAPRFERPMKVTLVLDTSCGESLAGLDYALWVCDSPVNLPVAERL